MEVSVAQEESHPELMATQMDAYDGNFQKSRAPAKRRAPAPRTKTRAPAKRRAPAKKRATKTKTRTFVAIEEAKQEDIKSDFKMTERGGVSITPPVRDVMNALKSPEAAKICETTDKANVKDRGIHYAVLWKHCRDWLLEDSKVTNRATTGDCLKWIKKLTSSNESSEAAAIKAYFAQEKINSMRGFTFKLPTAFGVNKIIVKEDVKPVGKPSLFVSYTWGTSLPLMLFNLVRELKTFGDSVGVADATNLGLFSEITDDKNFNGRFWIDCFAINQHGGAHTADDVQNIKEVIKSTTHGTVLYLDDTLKPLTRIWCIYEMFHSIIYDKPIFCMIPKLNTGIYGKSSYVGLCFFLAAGLGDILVDVNKAEATVQSDRKTILTLIEEDYGCDKVNEKVRKMLKEQARQTMKNFLDRGEWNSAAFPNWSHKTRHERIKQMPEWLERLEKHLKLAKSKKEKFYRDQYVTLGIAFMNGEKCMDKWLGTPWNRKDAKLNQEIAALAKRSSARQGPKTQSGVASKSSTGPSKKMATKTRMTGLKTFAKRFVPSKLLAKEAEPEPVKMEAIAKDAQMANEADPEDMTAKKIRAFEEAMPAQMIAPPQGMPMQQEAFDDFEAEMRNEATPPSFDKEPAPSKTSTAVQDVDGVQKKWV